MLLRLIDQPSASAIQVNLQAEDQTITFTIDDFSSPISAAFYENLSWYFEHYLQLGLGDGNSIGAVVDSVETLLVVGAAVGITQMPQLFWQTRLICGADTQKPLIAQL